VRVLAREENHDLSFFKYAWFEREKEKGVSPFTTLTLTLSRRERE
jgi:hypothetical protein